MQVHFVIALYHFVLIKIMKTNIFGFFKTSICSENNKYRISLGVLMIMLDKSRVVYNLYKDYLKIKCFFGFE